PPEAFDERIAGPCVDEVGAQEVGFASFGARFVRDVLQAGQESLPRGQGVDRVLEGHRAEAGQTLPDLRPEIEGLGWNLVDQEVPGGVAHARSVPAFPERLLRWA